MKDDGAGTTGTAAAAAIRAEGRSLSLDDANRAAADSNEPVVASTAMKGTNDEEAHRRRFQPRIPTLRMMAMHAHFDCFSGAAGDMMLAACVDAHPHPQNLLGEIQRRIEDGMPELRGEFDLTCRRVLRGSGAIGGCKVDVASRYGHRPAPLPVPHLESVQGSAGVTEAHSHSHSHSHSHRQASNDGEGGGNEGNSHDDSDIHSHSHSHGHDGAQSQNRDHPTHGHENHNHTHDHGHTHDHDHDHGPSGPLRNLPQILSLLSDAPDRHIPPRVKRLAAHTFTELARAESLTHNSTPDAVHFHEVGAVDSIVDTVGTLLALHLSNVRTVSCSRLPLGEGTVWTSHGLLPVPAPATLRLMEGMAVCPGPPGSTGELVTPTAASLLRVLTGVADRGLGDEECGYDGDGRAPPFTVRRIGIGAGTKDFERHPNILRVVIGDSVVRPQRRRTAGGGIASPSTSGVAEAGLSVLEGSDEVVERVDAVRRRDGTAGSDDVASRSLHGGLVHDHNHDHDHKCRHLHQSPPESTTTEPPPSLDPASAEETTGTMVRPSDGKVGTTDSVSTSTQMSPAVPPPPPPWNTDRLIHLEANVDDATPEVLAYAVERLLSFTPSAARGGGGDRRPVVVDAWVHPIVMKKGRSAHAVHCLCLQDDEAKEDDGSGGRRASTGSGLDEVLEVLFRETTTLGVRVHRNVERAYLSRSFLRGVPTPYVGFGSDGRVDVKVARMGCGGGGGGGGRGHRGEGGDGPGAVITAKAEFDQCRAVAVATGVPLRKVADAAVRAAFLEEEDLDGGR